MKGREGSLREDRRKEGREDRLIDEKRPKEKGGRRREGGRMD